VVDDEPPPLAPVVGEHDLAGLLHLEAARLVLVFEFRHEISSVSRRAKIATIL
jgi:hypothetical protein